MLWSYRYFARDKTKLGIIRNASVWYRYQWVKNDRTCRSTATASRSDKWTYWLRLSKELTAYSEPQLEPRVNLDLWKIKTRSGDKKTTTRARNMKKWVVDHVKE